LPAASLCKVCANESAPIQLWMMVLMRIDELIGLN
jgi:hypothetical protein